MTESSTSRAARDGRTTDLAEASVTRRPAAVGRLPRPGRRRGRRPVHGRLLRGRRHVELRLRRARRRVRLVLRGRTTAPARVRRRPRPEQARRGRDQGHVPVRRRGPVLRLYAARAVPAGARRPVGGFSGIGAEMAITNTEDPSDLASCTSSATPAASWLSHRLTSHRRRPPESWRGLRPRRRRESVNGSTIGDQVSKIRGESGTDVARSSATTASRSM